MSLTMNLGEQGKSPSDRTLCGGIPAAGLSRRTIYRLLGNEADSPN